MCGRYRRTTQEEELARIYKIRIPLQRDLPISWNVAPQQDVWAVRRNPDTGARSLDALRWGLVPAWSKDPKAGYRTINARVETVDTSPSYRSAFKKRRCLIPADGFYEWSDLNGLKALLVSDAEIQGVRGTGPFEKVEPIWRQRIEGYGIQLKVQGLIAEGRVVAARYIESGTFRAPAFGNQPTVKSYELVAMEWFEMEGGKVKRRWGARDAASQAPQLGIEVPS